MKAAPLQPSPQEEQLHLEQSGGAGKLQEPLQEQSWRHTPVRGLRACYSHYCANVCHALDWVRSANNILDAEVPTTKNACSATVGRECQSDSLQVLLQMPNSKLRASRQDSMLASHYQNQDATTMCQHKLGHVDLLSRPTWWTSRLDEGELSTLSSCSSRESP